MSFFYKYRSRFLWFFAFLSIAHFIYYLAKPSEKLDTREWEKQSCLAEQSLEIVDLDCRYYNTKKWIFSQPALKYGEILSCHQLKTSRGAELYAEKKETACGAPKYWGTPQVMRDIGWDAYSIWWGRAALLFQRSKAEDWPGLIKAITDPRLVTAFPNKEHHHYPWLVSIIYFGVMKIQDSANPFTLQILHIFVWLLVSFLFYKTWPSAPKYLWFMFAFVPTASIFLTRLYADVWMVLWSLLIIFFFQRRYFLAMALVCMAMAFTKQEAIVQGPLLLLLLYSLLPKGAVVKGAMFTLFVSTFTFIFSLLFYGLFKSDFYVPLSSRLFDLNSIELFFRRILPYYLDVLFRPALWGALWPWSFFLLYKKREILGWRLFVPAIVLLLIPLAYLSFPFGYKEVVLTGSGRALWQTMPMIWFLLSREPINLPKKSAKLPL